MRRDAGTLRSLRIVAELVISSVILDSCPAQQPQLEFLCTNTDRNEEPALSANVDAASQGHRKLLFTCRDVGHQLDTVPSPHRRYTSRHP